MKLLSVIINIVFPLSITLLVVIILQLLYLNEKTRKLQREMPKSPNGSLNTHIEFFRKKLPKELYNSLGVLIIIIGLSIIYLYVPQATDLYCNIFLYVLFLGGIFVSLFYVIEEQIRISTSWESYLTHIYNQTKTLLGGRGKIKAVLNIRRQNIPYKRWFIK